MENASSAKPRLLFPLVLVSTILVISIGLNIYQALCTPKVERIWDFTFTYWFCVAGICSGVIYVGALSFISEKGDDPSLDLDVLHSLHMRYDNALDAVLKDYEITNREIERRENINLLVGSILITGSLIILGNTATAQNMPKFPYTLTSILMFVLWLFVLHLTTAKLDSETYPRVRAIEEALTQHFGYAFGVHQYTYSVMQKKEKKKKKDKKETRKRWALVRRWFWGIILIALSIAWLFVVVSQRTSAP